MPVNLSNYHQSKTAAALAMAWQTLTCCQYYLFSAFWKLSSPTWAWPAAGMYPRLSSSGILQPTGESRTCPTMCSDGSIGHCLCDGIQLVVQFLLFFSMFWAPKEGCSGVRQCKCWNSMLLLCTITNNGTMFLSITNLHHDDVPCLKANNCLQDIISSQNCKVWYYCCMKVIKYDFFFTCYFYLIWWLFCGAITSWCCKLCLVTSFSLVFFFSGRGFKSLGGCQSFSSFSGET